MYSEKETSSEVFTSEYSRTENSSQGSFPSSSELPLLLSLGNCSKICDLQNLKESDGNAPSCLLLTRFDSGKLGRGPCATSSHWRKKAYSICPASSVCQTLSDVSGCCL